MVSTRLVAALCATALLPGCYATEYFLQHKHEMTDTQVCGNWRSAGPRSNNYNAVLYAATIEELNRRQVSYQQCGTLLAAVDANIASMQKGMGVLLGVALVAAAARGGAVAPAPLPVTAPQDYEWDWDQFYDQANRVVWACRGLQTGQFALESACIGMVKIDLRWPGLRFTP